MKAFKVDMDGVTEVDMPDDFVIASDFDWDIVRLGKDHGAWVRDDALSQPALAVATVCDTPNVPLPAYVLGIVGGRRVNATMSLDELDAQVSQRRRVR